MKKMKMMKLMLKKQCLCTICDDYIFFEKREVQLQDWSDNPQIAKMVLWYCSNCKQGS